MEPRDLTRDHAVGCRGSPVLDDPRVVGARAGQAELAVAHPHEALPGEAPHHGREVERSVDAVERSEEHTSELQSLMRISYAVFCLKKKKHITLTNKDIINTIKE